MIVSAASKNSIERPYIPLPYAFWPNSNICLAVALLSACSCATCKLEPTQQMISPPCSSVRVLFCFWLGRQTLFFGALLPSVTLIAVWHVQRLLTIEWLSLQEGEL